MAGQPIQVPGEIAIKVAIGEVCLQWSRLEMALLGLICQIEPMEFEKASIMFGGLASLIHDCVLTGSIRFSAAV